MNHMDILKNAIGIVGERGADYGDASECFDKIAKMAAMLLDKPVTRYDVAILMHCVKLARMTENRLKRDNYLDGINYLAFAGEFIHTDAPSSAVEKEIEREIRRDLGLVNALNKPLEANPSFVDMVERLDAAEMAEKLSPKVKIDIAGAPTVKK